jgi:hypothetical protein
MGGDPTMPPPVRESGRAALSDQFPEAANSPQQWLNPRRDTFDNMKVKYLRRARPLLLGLILLVTLCVSLPALAVRNPVFGYSIDLPVGWADGDSSDPYHVAFISPNGDAMLQIMALDPGTASTGVAIAEHLLADISGEGEPAPFDYLGYSAALSDVAFMTAGNEVRGYMVAIDGYEADLVLLSFALIESYELAHDHLLSALDSFAMGDESRLYPGPVSHFFYPFPAPSARSNPIPFGGGTLAFRMDPGELDAGQVLVEREARILAPYGSLSRELFESAWRRYFRMIYRDSYMRLESLAAEIGARLDADHVPRVDFPHEILSWLQGFDYQRTGGLSDFQAPLSCVAGSVGDCDSLALTYVILLHHLDFDAIVMVSDRYAHALAAVDVQGPGARFEFEGRQWVVAEMTEDVALGQIAADMADPAGWIGVRMRLRLVE